MTNGQNRGGQLSEQAPDDRDRSHPPRDSEDWDRLDPAVLRTGQIDIYGIMNAGAQGQDGPEQGQPRDSADTGSKPEPEPAASVAASAQARDASWQGIAQPGPVRLLTRFVVGLAVPVGLLALAVRLVATPMFLWIEYNRPGFPDDPHGLTPEERMSLGSQGLDYVLNWAPPSFLSDIRTTNGLSWFRTEEVAHMTDVKLVAQTGLWLAVVVVLLAVVAWVLRRKVDSVGMLRAAMRGAWITIGLLVILGLVAAVAWGWFFAAFHALFFDSGTWTFSESDTLIRLYPMQFWVDAAASVGIVSLAGAVVVILCSRRVLRRRHGR